MRPERPSPRELGSAPLDDTGEDTAPLDDWPVDPAYAPPLFEPALEPQAPAPGRVPPRRARWPAALATIAVTLVLILGLALVWALSRPTSGVGKGGAASASAADKLTVPRLAGMTAANAGARLRTLGLRGDARPTPSQQPRGTVLGQSPVAGTRVPAGRTVVLLVAARQNLSLPSLVGVDLKEANRLLARAGIRSKVQRVQSDQPAGTIVRQAPPTLRGLPTGARVTLFVSSGVIVVPRVVGLHGDQAILALRRAKLDVETVARASTQPDGIVIDQRPAGGDHARPGTTVQIEVSHQSASGATTTTTTGGSPTPAQKVLMPRLVGLSLSSATQRLHQLGLGTDVQKISSSQTAGTVLAQVPVAGAQLRRGMTVTLRVATAPPKVAVPDVAGQTASAARQQLTGAGFQVSVVSQTVTDPSQDGVVVATSPTAGSSLVRGATVTITVGKLATDQTPSG